MVGIVFVVFLSIEMYVSVSESFMTKISFGQVIIFIVLFYYYFNLWNKLYFNILEINCFSNDCVKYINTFFHKLKVLILSTKETKVLLFKSVCFYL